MRQSRFYISLYIIIPFIITGLTIIATIISFRLTKYNLEQGSDPAQPVFWFILVISIIAFATGFALVRIILKPVERFVEKARRLASISGEKSGPGKDWSIDKIEQFTSVFDRVTSVLRCRDSQLCHQAKKWVALPSVGFQEIVFDTSQQLFERHATANRIHDGQSVGRSIGLFFVSKSRATNGDAAAPVVLEQADFQSGHQGDIQQEGRVARDLRDALI